MPISGALARPLSGPDRWRRLRPFVAWAALGFALAWVPPRVDPPWWLAAFGLGGALLAAIALVPWARWPERVEAAPVLAFLAVVPLLRLGSDDGYLGYLPLALLPVLWVALYHGSRTLLLGLAFLTLGLALPLPGRPQWTAHVLVLGAAAALGRAIQRYVGRLRAAAVEVADKTSAMRSDRDFTQAVLDGAGFLVIVMDTDGDVLLFNKRCEELTGYFSDDLVGRPFWMIKPERDDPDAVDAALGRLSADMFPNTFENDWRTADGQRRRIVWSNTALTDDDGHVTHVIGTGIDVTDQRHTERVFADVLNAAAEQAIIASNGAGMVTVFSAGAECLLGFDSSEVVGLLTLERFHVAAELQERAAELRLAVPREALYTPARQGLTEARDWTYVRRDGSRVPVSATVSVMRDDVGEITGYLAVARDVTQERRTVEAMAAALERERAAADRLRELDKVRSDLVATVSHELRTPLTSMLGNTEILIDGDAGPVRPAQARLLSAVERNARRLLSLIEDLLILSRIEAGQIKVNAAPVPIRAVVDGALEALEAERATRQVDLAVELPDEPLLVYGDKAQLERVVINLVHNALKFTPSGGNATVSVEDADGQVRLVVADTGMGIPVDEIDRIFERFFRSTRSHERQSQGTGLGLAITKSIVERHGGRIWARPADGTGTVVTCLLPCPPAG
jgi:PAS domain S-box-containing protein